MPRRADAAPVFQPTSAREYVVAKSLADLRAAPPQARPERSLRVCLRPDIMAEVQSLSSELAEVLTEAQGDGERAMPTRLGQGDPPRAGEIRARLSTLLEEMAEFEGDLGVRANRDDGDWRRWVNAHPARAEGEPGHDRDQGVAYGVCDADALLDDLETYAQSWNDDPLSPGDFGRIFEPSMATADKYAMATLVVTMYESRLDFQRVRSSLSGNLRRLNGSGSPALSGSPTSDSTDGSRAPSSAASTQTETKSA